MRRSTLLAGAALVAAMTTFTGTASATLVGFDDGDAGGFTGNAFFEAGGGNPGGSAHFDLAAFGLDLRTGGMGEPANPAFLGDFSGFSAVTFSFDIKVDSLTDFIGNQISRSIGISLIDRDIQGPSGPSGVFIEMDIINATTFDDWTTLTVTIDDPMQSDLPPGWIGFGDEDPNTFEPVLPAGASFASVLASVDEFHITSFVPGFFYTDAFWDVRIDNVSVTKIPAPGALAVLMVAGMCGGRRRR